MSKELVINLAHTLASSISTRAAIHLLKDIIDNHQETIIRLDFSDVTSISRSAAHELICIKFDLTNISKKEIHFDHVPSSINSIFQTVTDNTINMKPKNRYIATRTIKFEDLMASCLN